MIRNFSLTDKPTDKQSTFFALASASENLPAELTEEEKQWLEKKLQDKEELYSINRYNHWLLAAAVKPNDIAHQQLESWRLVGHKIATFCEKEKAAHLQLQLNQLSPEAALALCEGLLLSTYRFEKYKKEPKEHPLNTLEVTHPELKEEQLDELWAIVEGTFLARTLINEPLIYLTATQLALDAEAAGREAGFTVEVLEKAKITSLKMGGLLAVNAGSQDPPTFSILEYKPENAKNSQPLVLVGKGVVYDTGGLSLKPTGGSMDMMKSDMSGAAAVVGAVYAIAKAKLPVHVIGLIPATDNRPGENAVTPGDIITISDGTTVEILNTDAEGRLILADALVYAKRYNPAVVVDLATLTGAAARAIGPEGVVYMGTAEEKTKKQLEQSGEQVYERLVEFPLWDEYRKQLDSSVADMTNLGGANAGAITAGMFLKHFTDYPWLHLDIAGPAYLTKADGYRTKGGSGVGVRLLVEFAKKLIEK